jgi:hypothetical protein
MAEQKMQNSQFYSNIQDSDLRRKHRIRGAIVIVGRVGQEQVYRLQRIMYCSHSVYRNIFTKSNDIVTFQRSKTCEGYLMRFSATHSYASPINTELHVDVHKTCHICLYSTFNYSISVIDCHVIALCDCDALASMAKCPWLERMKRADFSQPVWPTITMCE